MKSKKTVGLIIFIVIAAAAVLGIYYYLMNRPADSTDMVEVTETGELSSMDIMADYPASPRAVVDLYSRYMACLYNEEYTDEDFKTLITKMRLVMDDELLSVNPEDSYYEAMLLDVTDYKNKNWTIANYTIPDSDEVTYKDIDGQSMALLTVSYFIKENTSYAKSYQNYILRKDSSGLWKIYGYSLKGTQDVDENGNAING